MELSDPISDSNTILIRWYHWRYCVCPFKIKAWRPRKDDPHVEFDPTSKCCFTIYKEEKK